MISNTNLKLELFTPSTSYNYDFPCSGFVVTSVGQGCRLGYITHTNPKGNLPTWVSNKLSSTFAPKLVKKLHKACVRYPTWKEANKREVKPWVYPEQIASPRINVHDVSCIALIVFLSSSCFTVICLPMYYFN